MADLNLEFVELCIVMHLNRKESINENSVSNSVSSHQNNISCICLGWKIRHFKATQNAEEVPLPFVLVPTTAR